MQIKKDERNEIKSTSHSRYRCQYHIVFAPKYRRKEIYGQLKKDIGEILRTLCKQKNVEIPSNAEKRPWGSVMALRDKLSQGRRRCN